MVVSPPCMSEADRYSLEALQSIHHVMDDDQDGGIEVEESVEFIIEDMKQQQTNKHSNLHREDQHITIEELWRGWKSSEVHNWTQDEVLRWLKEFVELPQYERNFKDFKVNGNTLPRIAANEPSFLSVQLRVQDQRDKQKLNIKALDVVLFGSPTRPHNYMKDLLLIVSVVMGVGGCWFATAQNKASKVHISKMMKDLESLQTAEQSLIDLQEQLMRAQEEKRNVAEEKQNLEVKMRDEIMGAQWEAHRLHELRQGAVTELSRLRYAEEELVQVRGALKQVEKDMQASWTSSEVLQQWLQLTHEVEVQYYNVKKQSAVQQLATAKEEAEKIKKKRSSVLGTLHVAHSSSLDQVDHKILQAKNALSEVTACLRERLHRWQQIERLCGFPLIRNSGLANLTAKLYSDSIALALPRVPQQSSMENWSNNTFGCPPVPVPPLKRSPRTQGSTICRPRRSGVVTQPSSAMISSDPDLLIPIRAPYSCFDEEENFLLKTLKKQDSQELFSDTEYMTSPPLSKMFHSPTVDASTQKLYHDETEQPPEPSIANPLSKEVEAVVPLHKMSTEELDVSLDVACRKMTKDKLLDTSLETHYLKMSKDESFIEPTSRKISGDWMEVPMDVTVRKGLSCELDAEFPSRKLERDMMGDLMDTSSRNIYREVSDLPLDVRKILWHELEVSTDQQAPRKISRDMMEASFDSTSRKIGRDDAEHRSDSVSRRITRDSMGISLDTGSRKLTRNKGECQDELESSAGSLRRRIPRMPRDDSSMDNPTGKIWDTVDVPAEMPKQAALKEEFGASESNSSPGRFGQPDLMVTSQVPWTLSDLFPVGPLSQLVYDGILEKACNSSTPNLPQSRPPAEVEPPLPPPRVAIPSLTSPPEAREQKNKDREKSRKSLKLKNLFKKKNESTPEKPPSGLQKL
uniref:SAM domain-containing protein n=1 Tax=Scophthalmus maximus TaxID=52904 RepID=A0A8D3CQK3_SCOMX